MEKLEKMTARERFLVACNDSTPAEVLAELAKDKDANVREAAARCNR